MSSFCWMYPTVHHLGSRVSLTDSLFFVLWAKFNMGRDVPSDFMTRTNMFMVRDIFGREWGREPKILYAILVVVCQCLTWPWCQMVRFFLGSVGRSAVGFDVYG